VVVDNLGGTSTVRTMTGALTTAFLNALIGVGGAFVFVIIGTWGGHTQKWTFGVEACLFGVASMLVVLTFVGVWKEFWLKIFNKGNILLGEAEEANGAFYTIFTFSLEIFTIQAGQERLKYGRTRWKMCENVSRGITLSLTHTGIFI
jgi:hypothetical protein